MADVPEPYRLGSVDVMPYRMFLDRLPRLLCLYRARCSLSASSSSASSDAGS